MNCKCVKDLLALANAEKVSLTKEESEAFFAKQSVNELTPEDIEGIVGGSCGNVCPEDISTSC